MSSDDLEQSLSTLFRELVAGAPDTFAFVLNPGDPGLLASLDRLSAENASVSRDGGGSIAAHVRHLAYGLSLMNLWAAGEENPFEDADYSAAWEQRAVSEHEWAELRKQLRDEVDAWSSALRSPRIANEVDLNGVIGSIVHLAYHFGAIRQIDATIRGPRASD